MSDASFPVPSFHFIVNLGGKENLSFREVSGLSQTAEVIEYRYGHSKSFVTEKRLGLMKTEKVVLSRGVIQSKKELPDTFWKGVHSPSEGKYKYHSESTKEFMAMEVKLLDEKEQIMVTWKFDKVYPVSLKVSDLHAEKNEIAIESLEIVHEGYKVEF